MIERAPVAALDGGPDEAVDPTRSRVDDGEAVGAPGVYLDVTAVGGSRSTETSL